MTDLDDRVELAAADPGGMLAAIEAAPAQLAEAIRRARAVGDLPDGAGVDAVVVCGMGGSGIAGDVLAAVAGPRIHLPVAVVKGYRIPAYVGRKTLVFCSSYSGDTEETLACFDEAHDRGARIVAVTGGGELAKRAADAAVPVIAPLEGLKPRAALWSLAVPPLVALERTGLLPDQSEEIDGARRALELAAESCGTGTPADRNPAKRLAAQLEGMLPVVWGQEGPLGVAALRWRCQLNENAKVPAYSRVIPEANHNDIAGYDPGLPLLDRVAVVALRAAEEDPRIARRFAPALSAVRERVGTVTEVTVEGDGVFGRLAAAVALGDFVSAYLALLRGVDPTPVAAIQRLKDELRLLE